MAALKSEVPPFFQSWLSFDCGKCGRCGRHFEKLSSTPKTTSPRTSIRDWARFIHHRRANLITRTRETVLNVWLAEELRKRGLDAREESAQTGNYAIDVEVRIGPVVVAVEAKHGQTPEGYRRCPQETHSRPLTKPLPNLIFEVRLPPYDQPLLLQHLIRRLRRRSCIHRPRTYYPRLLQCADPILRPSPTCPRELRDCALRVSEPRSVSSPASLRTSTGGWGRGVAGIPKSAGCSTTS